MNKSIKKKVGAAIFLSMIVFVIAGYWAVIFVLSVSGVN